MARVWEHPFLNVFRHFKVDEWKRSTKEGDVATVMDKTLKCTVYRIRGSVSASNYIQLPKTSTQSLGLTGRYLYVLFRPLSPKHFIIHLDLSTKDGQVIRVSLSNLFKEFKSTATWLQFPFICEAGMSRKDLAGVAPPGAHWTFLQLDLHDILLVYLNLRYSHLKRVRLCSSLLVRSLYTSNLCFDPAVTVTEARQARLPVTPVPREMAFPVPKGESWHDHYVHIRFPSNSSAASSELIQKSCFPPKAVFPRHVPQLLPHLVTFSKPRQDRVSPEVQMLGPTASYQAPSAPGPLPEESLSCEHSEVSGVSGPNGHRQEPSACADATDKHATGNGLQVSVRKLAVVATDLEDVAVNESFLPDPVLRLKGVIGFGGHSTKWALWTKDGSAVVYPCHAVIVVLHIDSFEQRFFLGHTDKVSALALDGNNSLLASAQAQTPSMLRLWDFQTGGCLSLFRSPVHTVCSLSFSSSGALLCGVGKDHHGRTMVVVWDMDQVRQGGETVILTKVHTDIDIQAFEVASFDETRMVSCGRGSVRLWRLRGGGLRSCPVNLGEHHALEFTDLAFGQAQDSRTLYVCSRSGYILEIDHQRMAVRHTRRLLPVQTPGSPLPQKQTFSSGMWPLLCWGTSPDAFADAFFPPGPGIAISSLSVSQAACAVGSEDGYLRLWPLDFSSVLLEAEHEGPISSVCLSPDGLHVLSTTSLGYLGFLDIPSQEYSVLMRSHTALVLALAIECSRGQLATVSQDHTVRIWDLATLQQLYDFTSPEEAPCAVAFHPTQPTFFCGFSSGAVRSFSLEAAEVLVEHRCHRGAITGLVASPDGSLLFSTCSQGTLSQYHCVTTCSRVLHVAANVVCQDTCLSPNALTVSGDSHLLAFVGPSKYTVTIMDASSLDNLLQVDVSTLDVGSSRLDSAVALCFGPAPTNHLLVSTLSNKVVVLDSTSGRVVRELSGVCPMACPSLALSGDARFLLTAADRAIKVWDYSMKTSPDCQVYIGHSEPVQAVAFTPDQQQLLSVGDAIFLWDILALPERSSSGSIRGLLGTPLTCDAGLNARQLEDPVSGANGLPRQQVPVPSQTPPPWLGICAGPSEGSDGTFSVLDDEGPSEESHGAEGLHPTSGPPVLVQKEAYGAGDGACGVARGLCSFGMLTHTCGWPSKQGAQSTRRASAQPAVRPDSYKHFMARYKASQMAKNVSFPAAGDELLHLKTVVGYNGNGRANMIWRPDTGFFAYTCGCLVVVEDLHSGAQQHWFGHPEEISTLALSHDAQVLASASGRGGSASCCQIRVWDVPGGSCQQLLSHHCTAVQALAFSLDDRLLVTLGDYGDCTLALWSTATYELVSSTHLLEPMHGVAFNPWDTSELACVGQGALTLWLMQHCESDINLKVHQEPIPEAVGAGELTSLCYGAEPLLYCGSNAGQICVWDTRARRCFLAWGADNGEIGVLLCSGSRLVSGSNTRRLRLWAVGAVPELRRKGSGASSSSVFMERELTLDGAIVSAVFHDSMDMGVVGTTAGTLWYVSWAEGTSTRLISGHRSKVNEVVFSPRESHCATCGDDGSVRVWSLASMELVIQFQVLNQSCLCLAWSPTSCGHPEQQHVAAGYSDGTLRVFSISQTALELKMHPHPAALTAIFFSADGQTILSGDKDGLIAVSCPRTGMTFRVLSDHRGAPISTIQSTNKEYREFGVEGTDLWLAASRDQRVSIWASDWLRGHCELVDWLSFPAPTLLEDPGCPPPSLAAFCPWDRALLVCTGLGPHPEVIFYSLCQKQVVEKIPLPFFAISLSLSPGAHLIAIGFTERVLRLVDCVTEATQDFAGHDDWVQLCRFTPSAHLLFTAAHNEILVWEVTGY
ncbi:WD repeat-containing protein 90 isoform X1 [Pteropus medius]|uniref:WD repeat-containing protein 90 isoform X1 n=2 Tax=Pteropus vampyrus TaxID=132908 RepID=UPI00196B3A99|nr:WD repeat-containing protein 90 isoform X1 [Pteropus giganteus]